VKYLLDTNVLREMHPRGHKNVRLWLATIDDSELCISALTIKEIQEGIAREHTRRPTQQTLDAQDRLDALVQVYRDRIISIDREIAAEWGRLVGTKAKHNDDMALAATARVRGLVLVTRNVADFQGRGVEVLDPFKKAARIIAV
jgi:predicted nucleic acid-binding protein